MPRKQQNPTGARILDTALELFRTQGFEETTMREIAFKAGVATGAAYYYYPSKDAIVVALYQQAFDEMDSGIQKALSAQGGLEARMRALIQVKLDALARNRIVLRGILKNSANPAHPVSPFSKESKAFRRMEIGWFRQILKQEGVHLSGELQKRMPEVLWLLHIGVVFFWIADESPRQINTKRLIDQGMNTVTALLRLAPPASLVEAS